MAKSDRWLDEQDLWTRGMFERWSRLHPKGHKVIDRVLDLKNDIDRERKRRATVRG